MEDGVRSRRLAGQELQALLLFLSVRQLRRDPNERIAGIAWHGSILLLVYAFFSRFFNENYVGFIAATLCIGLLTSRHREQPVIAETPAQQTTYIPPGR